MLERYIRTPYQTILVDPVAHLLLRCGYRKPNQITLLAAFTGVLAGISLHFTWTLLAIVLLLISGYLDTLDGTLARFSEQNTSLGSVFDIMADRLVEISIVLGLYSMAPLIRATASIWLLSSFLFCITSFLVVGIFSKKEGEKQFFYSPGLIERPETFLFFILMIIFPSFFNWWAYLLSILVFYTATMRIWQFYQRQ